ncbi:cation:proton antiporter [Candidatus Kinetoplastidibacterium crithidiae]|uniref:CPA1 family monovalent cation:H+ antiporter n=1 Tax=Candidatus Kinetoplastidibacterium crithidiae TCC036E TaxID=1208918 RepID=M1L3M6_9PROT|nr:cation:proton antiporter [Candidatus Kinetoplastibacterium crithidii]AFZ83061.1 monovalent cation:H+ antiporter, CPA1 family [Candidatus Kinetoplastibacterium crithidii (ex Angomonas deanei ATCC 30255)]AGF47338.1 CPA1 family monovalent cation:H+ antiporter [Candidatus Kinetoplastibacterium crithidii TCC036E]
MNVGFIVFGLAGLLTLVCFLSPIAVRIKLPYSVLLAIVGFFLGIIVHTHSWAPLLVSDFLESLGSLKISSETFLMVFLPVLLFETALSMSVRRLLDDIGPILMMAIVAVVVCTIVVGFTLNEISSYGLVSCLLLGSIVATTDPVAVVGIFREVGAPKRLTTLVEGESLFNDAASIALYTVLLVVLVGKAELSMKTVVNDFIVLFIGGGIAGYVMGRFACFLFSWLRDFPAAEITLTLTLAYLSFFISEHYLHVSGVVATVIAGLVVGSTGRTRMSSTTSKYLSKFWGQIGFWANSLIFLFSAMLIPRFMGTLDLQMLKLILIVFVVTLLARAIVIFGFLPVLGITKLGTTVNLPYKSVMLWGGLRGAVSLALALAVTENVLVPEELRHFIAIVTTGFVLMTLFVNGITLRPLIKILKLNELSHIETTIRNQVLGVTLEELQERTEEIAQTEHIGKDSLERVQAVFRSSLSRLHDVQLAQMNREERISAGLAILSQREQEMFLDILKAKLVDEKVADTLLSRAEHLEDVVRIKGLYGFESAIEYDLHYSISFRVSLWFQRVFGIQFWLAKNLGYRFVTLMSKRSVAQRLICFAKEQVSPILGEEITEIIINAHKKRLNCIENALQAMNLQYPIYAMYLQEVYLGRAAFELERVRYLDMLENSLISGEVYDDLITKSQNRWKHIDKNPKLDIELSSSELIKKVPFFHELSPKSLKAISKLLKPILALPDQVVITKEKHSDKMYFVASGAVAMHLPDGTKIELGSGEFFGELSLFGQAHLISKVTSLGYSKLLLLSAKDLRALLSKDSALLELIENVARQRILAIDVWREHGSIIPDEDLDPS